MSGALAPALYQQIEDANGKPVAGAKIFTYQAGTTTPAVVYTDVNLSVPAANPIVADTAGVWSAYLVTAVGYKFVIQDASGATLRTIDNVVGAYAPPTVAPPPVVQVTTLTGTVNDFALTPNCRFLRVNAASVLTLTGLSAGTDGQLLTIENMGAARVDLSPAATGSLAPNRLTHWVMSGPTSLSPFNPNQRGGVATYEYAAGSSGASSWRLVAHEQGAMLPFTPTLGGTAVYGTQGGFYRLAGSVLYLQIQLTVTTLGTGSPSTITTGLPYTVQGQGTVTIPYWAGLAIAQASLGGLLTGAVGITLGGVPAIGASVTYPVNAIGSGTALSLTGQVAVS
jgi:hypothetical protein